MTGQAVGASVYARLRASAFVASMTTCNDAPPLPLLLLMKRCRKLRGAHVSLQGLGSVPESTGNTPPRR